MSMCQRNLMGVRGKGFYWVAAQAVGAAQGALELAVRYTRERKAFEEPLSHFQANPV